MDNFGLLALIYAFTYAGGGFVAIFIPVLLKLAGLGPLEVGLVSASSPIAAILGVIVLGWLFDRNKEWRKVLYIVSMCVSFAFFCCIPVAVLFLRTNAFALSIVSVMLAASLNAAAGTLLDAIAVETTKQNEYGRLRLFGALGYGLGAGVVGLLLFFINPVDGSWEQWVVHYAPYVFSNAVGMIIALFLKPVKEMQEEGPIKSATDSEAGDLLVRTDDDDVDSKAEKKLKRLSTEAIVGLILFGFVVFICGCASGVINTFLFVFFETLPDGTGLTQGISVFITTMFEIPVFFFSKKILDRVSAEWLVSVSLVSYCIRMMSYYLFAIYRPSAYYAFFSETLHGLTFALLWAATVARVQALVKGGYTKSGLTMAVAAGVSQLGRSLASFAGGLALQHGASMEMVWFVTLIAMCAIFIIWTIGAMFMTKCRLKRDLGVVGL